MSRAQRGEALTPLSRLSKAHSPVPPTRPTPPSQRTWVHWTGWLCRSSLPEQHCVPNRHLAGIEVRRACWNLHGDLVLT